MRTTKGMPIRIVPDARDEFTMVFPGAAIQDLPGYTAYVHSLTCDEKGCRPAEAERVATYPPFMRTRNAEWRSKIERTSNARYNEPRARWKRRSRDFSWKSKNVAPD